MRYYPAKGEQPIAGVSFCYSPEHGTWVIQRYTYATRERVVTDVYPEPRPCHRQGDLGPWRERVTAALKIDAWTTLTDVYGYWDHASLYA